MATPEQARAYYWRNHTKARKDQSLWRQAHPGYQRKWWKSSAAAARLAEKYWPHRKAWEDHFKVKIPVDERGHHFCIHHKDQNPDNNEPTNLLCLNDAEHKKLHRLIRERENE